MEVPMEVGTLRRGWASASFANRRTWAWALAATVPVAAAGYLAHDLVAGRLRTLDVIAWSSIAWGVMLWIADRRPGSRDVYGTGWAGALFIGAAQAVSLVPGTSRSGITMTAGLFAGLSRTAAVRFSFLLAVVVGALAGASEMAEMIKAGMDTPWPSVAVGFAVAFIAAYAAIHYFLKFISRASMTPFVIYRVLLGAALLILFAWWRYRLIVRMNRRIAASEEKFRDLIEGAVPGVLIHRDLRPLFVNRSYARIFGYDAPEELLRQPSVLDHVAPREHGRLRGFMAAPMTSMP